jgi:hypothetical protein
MKYLDNEILYNDNYATIECISKKFGNFKDKGKTVHLHRYKEFLHCNKTCHKI